MGAFTGSHGASGHIFQITIWPNGVGKFIIRRYDRSGINILADTLDHHLRRPHVHGFARVLPAHAPSPLGRVPEQVLQGRWLQIPALFFHYDTAVSTRRAEVSMSMIIMMEFSGEPTTVHL